MAPTGVDDLRLLLKDWKRACGDTELNIRLSFQLSAVSLKSEILISGSSGGSYIIETVIEKNHQMRGTNI